MKKMCKQIIIIWEMFMHAGGKISNQSKITPAKMDIGKMVEGNTYNVSRVWRP